MGPLRAAVRDLVSSPGAPQADALARALTAAPPGPELAALIAEVLELPAVHEVTDSSRRTVRWLLVDRLLSLGFPHALGVSPDDLDYHNQHRPKPGWIPATVTSAVSLLTFCWSLPVGALSALFALGEGREFTVGAAGMLVAAAHAVAAFVTSRRVARGEPAPLLRPLGWAFLLGPVFVGLAQHTFREGAALALLFGAPAMITATCCAMTGVWVDVEEAALKAEPKPRREPADYRDSTSAGDSVRYFASTSAISSNSDSS